jgi:hypothetical protein
VTGPYVPPHWALGQGRTFRITVSSVAGRNGPWSCPAKTNHGARKIAGSLTPNDRSGWRREWDPAERLWFALGDAMTAVDAGTTIADAAAADDRLTHAQRRYVVHALHELADLPDLIAADAGVPVQYVPGRTEYTGDWGQIYPTGPEYGTNDGTVRETVRLRLKDLKDPTTDDALDFAATAAFVLARSGDGYERVRVGEFSLHTGRYQRLFDGTPQQAADFYAERGRPVQHAMSGTTLNPGSQCAGCDFLTVCPGPTTLRGALGIPGRAVATRAVTGTDLHAYDYCPTKFHAQRRAHLPDRPDPTAPPADDGPRARGTAVHRLLRWAHSREPHRACTDGDYPDPAADPDAARAAADAAGVHVDDYRRARPYLLRHVNQCLLGYAGLTGFTTEPRHTIYDPDSDTVLVAEPDLTFSVAPDARVWRETKTTTRALPVDEADALNTFPAFAFNAALLAAGADGNARGAGAAELEVLGTDADHVYVVPMSDGALVATAQRVVAEIAHRWSQDLRFERRPSTACPTCPVHGWCDPPTSPAPPARDHEDREFLGIPDPF